MARCLRDRTLLLICDGEGTNAHRTHLMECEACAARYRQLRHHLATISQVLRKEPPPKPVSYLFPPFNACWLPTAAGLALALALIWVGVRIWSPSPPLPLKETGNVEIWSLLEGFSADLFLLNEAVAEELWTKDPDFYGPAPGEEWPSEWYYPSTGGEVESLME